MYLIIYLKFEKNEKFINMRSILEITNASRNYSMYYNKLSKHELSNLETYFEQIPLSRMLYLFLSFFSFYFLIC